MKPWTRKKGLRSAWYEWACFTGGWLVSIKLRGRWRDPYGAAIRGGYWSGAVPRRP